jgi:hypothetical protein
MIVLVARKSNIENGLKYQTNIDLNLFDTILGIYNTRVDIEGSWAVIEQEISVS